MANILHTACMLIPIAIKKNKNKYCLQAAFFKQHTRHYIIDLSTVTLVKLATTRQVVPDDTHVERKSCVLHGIRLIKHVNGCVRLSFTLPFLLLNQPNISLLQREGTSSQPLLATVFYYYQQRKV